MSRLPKNLEFLKNLENESLDKKPEIFKKPLVSDINHSKL